jgi:SHS2 domain-containing protein
LLRRRAQRKLLVPTFGFVMSHLLPRWEHFDHDADVGVRGLGHTRAEAFEQAALAMTAAITEPALVRPLTRVELSCQDDDDELLLTDWLNALVYEMDTRRMLFGRFRVRLQGRSLTALAEGEPIDPRRHRPAVEVKGATLTELKVAQQADGSWLAQCVVDV